MEFQVSAADGGVVRTFGRSRLAEDIKNEFWIRDDAVLDMACGDEHSAIITASGRLLTFGSNEWGQLGLGNTNIATKPTIVKGLKHEKSICIACGRSHTLVATDSGKIFAFGSNADGQIGVGDGSVKLEPIEVPNLPEAQYKLLSAGAEHSAALTETGRMFVWGSGSAGQLGLGDGYKESVMPTELKLASTIIHMSCGYYHSAIVTANGKLHTFGEKEEGKLGLKQSQLQKDCFTPQQVNGIPEKVTQVSCGGSHTSCITVCGKLYVFGDGSCGQLGLGTKQLLASKPHLVTADFDDQKISGVSCGENHTAVLTANGNLYATGDGRHGKLGFSQENFSNIFTFTQLDHLSYLNIKQMCCGGCHMLILAVHREENAVSNNKTPLIITNDSFTLPRESNTIARSRRRQRMGTLEPLNVNSLPSLACAPPNSNSLDVSLSKLPQIQQSENYDDDIVETEQSHNMKLALNLSAVTRHADSDVDFDSDNGSEFSTLNKTHVAQLNDVSTLKPVMKGSSKPFQESQSSENETSDDGGSEKPDEAGDEEKDSQMSPVKEQNRVDEPVEETQTSSANNSNDDFTEQESKNDEVDNIEENDKQKKSKVGNFFNSLRRSMRKKKANDRHDETSNSEQISSDVITETTELSQVHDKKPKKSSKQPKQLDSKKSKACSIL